MGTAAAPVSAIAAPGTARRRPSPREIPPVPQRRSPGPAGRFRCPAGPSVRHCGPRGTPAPGPAGRPDRGGPPPGTPPSEPDRPRLRRSAALLRTHLCKRHPGPPARRCPPAIPVPARTRPWRRTRRTAAASAAAAAPRRQRRSRKEGPLPPASPGEGSENRTPAGIPPRHRPRPGLPPERSAAGAESPPPGARCKAAADSPSGHSAQTHCPHIPPPRRRLPSSWAPL